MSACVESVDRERLDRRLAKLERARRWPPDLIADLRRLIQSGEDAELYRINPMRYAASHGLDPGTALELFVHGVGRRLFTLEWGLVCRGCGELVDSHDRLDQLSSHFVCSICERTHKTHLDEQVEVNFTIRAEIRRLRFHDPEQLTLEEYFYERCFSKNIRVRDHHGQALTEYVRERTVLLTVLGAGEKHTVELDLRAGWVIGNPRAKVTIEGEPTSEVQTVTLRYDGTEWLPRPTARPGPMKLELVNDTERPVRALMYFTPIVTFFDYAPFVSGQDLLNQTIFKQQLRLEVVRRGAAIPIADNTLLFTDLAGSTELYDQLGDERAFALVSVHLERVAGVVARHSGVVVKTIGDAIMASFSRPLDAVEAASTMIELERASGSTGVQLESRIGIHRGPCILVNVGDSLDYFGQTVNVAARLGSCGNPGDVCVSEAVYADPAVARSRADRGSAPEQVLLKGIDAPFTIYRLTSTS